MWHTHQRGGGGWYGRHVRSHLRRRLFWALAGTVLLTTLVVGAVMTAVSLGSEGSPWRRQVDQGRAWLGKQLGKTWADPAARDAFAREAASDLDVNVTLQDTSGGVLLVLGADCGPRAMRIPATRDGVEVGAALVCGRAADGTHHWRAIVGLALVVAMFWAASGRVARRIARPLDELAQVARRLGEGDLKARATLACREPDEVGVVAEAVNEMASRIEKQLQDQKELLAGVSHELRTPLARVRLISELGRDGGATPKTFDDLDREVDEMDALVGQLLASARLDFGTLSRQPVEVVDQAVRALERAAVAPELLQAQGAPGAVQADPTLLARALSNLLDNAKRHGGGVAALRLERTADQVRFEVHDSGKGFEPGREATVFEPFQEGGQARADGLGLGLALVRRIARAHGGDAFARNRGGGGAVVGFWLPSGAGPGATGQ